MISWFFFTGADPSNVAVVEISARTVFGIRHGLETLYQLIARGKYCATQNGQYLLHEISNDHWSSLESRY